MLLVVVVLVRLGGATSGWWGRLLVCQERVCMRTHVRGGGRRQQRRDGGDGAGCWVSLVVVGVEQQLRGCDGDEAVCSQTGLAELTSSPL